MWLMLLALCTYLHSQEFEDTYISQTDSVCEAIEYRDDACIFPIEQGDWRYEHSQTESQK